MPISQHEGLYPTGPLPSAAPLASHEFLRRQETPSASLLQSLFESPRILYIPASPTDPQIPPSLFIRRAFSASFMYFRLLRLAYWSARLLCIAPYNFSQSASGRSPTNIRPNRPNMRRQMLPSEISYLRRPHPSLPDTPHITSFEFQSCFGTSHMKMQHRRHVAPYRWNSRRIHFVVLRAPHFSLGPITPWQHSPWHGCAYCQNHRIANRAGPGRWDTRLFKSPEILIPFPIVISPLHLLMLRPLPISS